MLAFKLYSFPVKGITTILFKYINLLDPKFSLYSVWWFFLSPNILGYNPIFRIHSLFGLRTIKYIYMFMCRVWTLPNYIDYSKQLWIESPPLYCIVTPKPIMHSKNCLRCVMLKKLKFNQLSSSYNLGFKAFQKFTGKAMSLLQTLHFLKIK